MKSILILDRDDLGEKNKLKKVKDIEMTDFNSASYEKMSQYDITIFICHLLNKTLVLKDRYSDYGRTIFQKDDESSLARFLLRKI